VVSLSCGGAIAGAAIGRVGIGIRSPFSDTVTAASQRRIGISNAFPRLAAGAASAMRRGLHDA
jgi:hypothetical protein